MIRSTEFAPERSTHAVCLELARILDFIGQPITAGMVIQRNMLRFPEEWKLVLERVNQLLRENHVMEAYHLNCESLKYHSYAGRLWSSMIQLTHQYVRMIASSVGCTDRHMHCVHSTVHWSTCLVLARCGAKERESL